MRAKLNFCVFRAALTELSDPELIKEADKHYFLRAARDDATEPTDFDYDSYLPIDYTHAQLGEAISVPFKIADDCNNTQVRLPPQHDVWTDCVLVELKPEY